MLVVVKMTMRRSLVAWMTVWKTEWRKTTEILNTESRRQARKWLDRSNDVSTEFAAGWVITDVPYWTYTWASFLLRTRNMWSSTPSMLGEDCVIRVTFWAGYFFFVVLFFHTEDCEKRQFCYCTHSCEHYTCISYTNENVFIRRNKENIKKIKKK